MTRGVMYSSLSFNVVEAMLSRNTEERRACRNSHPYLNVSSLYIETKEGLICSWLCTPRLIHSGEAVMEHRVLYKPCGHFFNRRRFSFFIRLRCHFQRICPFFFQRRELRFISGEGKSPCLKRFGFSGSMSACGSKSVCPTIIYSRGAQGNRR